MELKLRAQLIDRLHNSTFNRTIVELKLGRAGKQKISRWAFNRTIVELKQRYRINSSTLIVDL